MPDELRVLAALLVSFGAVLALTPVAIRLAARTGFYDHPVGYKAHAAPTAYLGGAALVSGFVLGALPFAGDLARFAPIAGCALALCALGTLDDRITVRPRYRVLAALAAATALWAAGLGWSFVASELEQLILTCVWVLGFTNALNLMDNMDGAASTVGSVCAAGIAALAMINGDPALAVMAVALVGGCLAFLRYNLRPRASARIFLGDGGSMPLGFILAAAAMEIPADGDVGWPVLLGAALLLGLPVLDTLLVVVSRTRRGVSLMTGGHDHITHRLYLRFGSTRDVAVTLALTQASVSFVAIAALEYGRTAVIVAALSCLGAGLALIAMLENPGWAAARANKGEAAQARRGEAIGAMRE